MFRRTIARLIRIASCLLVIFAGMGPATAQNFDPADLAIRRVVVTEYQNGVRVATWPWRRLYSFDQALMMIPMDPVLPMNRRPFILNHPHRLVITETGPDGDVTRELTLGGGGYRFRYVIAAATWRATPANLVPYIQKNLTPWTAAAGPPLLWVRMPTGAGALNDPEDVRVMKNYLDQARPLSLSEMQSQPLTTPRSQVVTVTPHPDLRNWPDRVVVGPQVLRLVNDDGHSMMFQDRQNWWGRAMAERGR